MAKIKLNPIVEGLTGRFGGLVFARMNEESIVRHRPDFTGVTPTPGQLAHREEFRLAVLYGKTILADPAVKAVYDEAAQDEGISAFALAVGDFMNAPAVREIDLSAYAGHTGETIRIRAADDVDVTGVSVAIRDTGGTLLEQGTATLNPTDATWHYVTTTNLSPGQSVSIEVTAADRPGHRTSLTQSRP